MAEDVFLMAQSLNSRGRGLVLGLQGAAGVGGWAPSGCRDDGQARCPVLSVFTCSPLSLSGASHTSLHVSLPSSLGLNHYGVVLFHQGR